MDESENMKQIPTWLKWILAILAGIVIVAVGLYAAVWWMFYGW